MAPSAAKPYRMCLTQALLLFIWGCSCAAQSQHNSTTLTVTDVITSRSNLVSLTLMFVDIPVLRTCISFSVGSANQVTESKV